MSFVAAIAAAGGIYAGVSGNQKSQDAKGAQGKAVAAADQGVAQRAPFLNAATKELPTINDAASLASLYGKNPTYEAINNPLLDQANTTAGATLKNLTTSAPNYTALAKTSLADLQAQAAPELAKALKSVQDAAGASGRIGSEGVTSSLGDVYDNYTRNLMQSENELVANAEQAGQTNALNTLSAADAFGAQQYGQSAADRATKLALEQQGITNTENEVGQRTAQTLSLGELGTGYNPASTYQDAANAEEAQAQQSANTTGQLFDALGNLVTSRPSPSGSLSNGGLIAEDYGY